MRGGSARLWARKGLGKSTLDYVLAGKPRYKVISGEILIDGRVSAGARAETRCLKGLFLAFNIRSEIPGVAEK